MKLLLFHACLAVVCCAAAAPGQAVPREASAAVDALSRASVNALHEKSKDPRPELVLAFLDTLINPYDEIDLRATAARLADKLPGYRWKSITISAAEAPEQIQAAKPDFLFAPSAFVMTNALEKSFSAFRIATRKPKAAEHADQAVGAAFVVSSSSGFTTLSDLKGKIAGASLPTALEGWIAASGELADRGFDPETFFSRVDFRNNAYPDVISSLLAGRIDVAILPTCLLETLSNHRLIDAEGLSVAAQKDDGLACLHSTALYPEINLLALDSAPERAVRDVTIALLSSSSPESSFEWLTNVPLTRVQQLFESLRIGPYAYLRTTSLKAFVERWKTEIGAALLFILFLAANEVRLHILVKKRTADLQAAIKEQQHAEQQASLMRTRLAAFERRSAVEQMSGMIAHEVNAPIGAIRTYACVLKLSAPQLLAGAAAEALEGIDKAAVRISDIVARVRSYAKQSSSAHEPCRVDELAKKSLRELARELPPETRVMIEEHFSGDCIVSGNPLELELLVLNLLRNAAGAALAAVSAGIEPRVILRTERVEKQIRITVANSSAGNLAGIASELNSLSASIRMDARLPNDTFLKHHSLSGLGLGLTLCRGIADSHCASFRYEADEAFIIAIVEFEALTADHLSKHISEPS